MPVNTDSRHKHVKVREMCFLCDSACNKSYQTTFKPGNQFNSSNSIKPNDGVISSEFPKFLLSYRYLVYTLTNRRIKGISIP